MRNKPFLVDGIKCECGRPTYFHITNVVPENGQVNIACQRYLYTRGEDGCDGFIFNGKMHLNQWKVEEIPDRKEFGYRGAYTK